MASFFRRRIAHKVLSMLQRKQELKTPLSPNLISSLVKVNRFKCPEAQLILPWKQIERLCDQTISINPKEFVRLLRNQGLPTAEGFIDIQLAESPLLSLIFTVDKHVFSRMVLLDIFNNEEDLAKSSCLFDDIKKKNIVVQCGVPSIGEVCHLTHFRSLIYSNFVTNINKFVGHNVTKIAHVNDWGLTTAAFLTGFRHFKTGEIVQKKGENHLLQIYKAAIAEYNSDFQFKLNTNNCYEKLKQGDASIIYEWENLRQECLDYYDLIYKRIGVHFDEQCFDSAYFQKSEKIANQLSDIIFQNDDRILFEDLGDDSYINKVKDIDSALYDLSRYITIAAELKEKYNFDMMYYISPSSATDFMSSLFYMMKKLNYAWTEDLHQVKLKLIESFDSKRRKKLSIETVLDQVKNGMMTKLHENLQMEHNESLDEMAECLSLSSLIINDMKHRRNVDYEFLWEHVISFKKDTAASFQLCYAGLKGFSETDLHLYPK